jgi:hypothetical protein
LIPVSRVISYNVVVAETARLRQRRAVPPHGHVRRRPRSGTPRRWARGTVADGPFPAEVPGPGRGRTVGEARRLRCQTTPSSAAASIRCSQGSTGTSTRADRSPGVRGRARTYDFSWGTIQNDLRLNAADRPVLADPTVPEAMLLVAAGNEGPSGGRSRIRPRRRTPEAGRDLQPQLRRLPTRRHAGVTEASVPRRSRRTAWRPC